MTRQPVTSSNLKSVGYDPEKKVLEVEFRSGAVHQYHDVPVHHHQQLLKASSPGTYFHGHIKFGFDSKQVN